MRITEDDNSKLVLTKEDVEHLKEFMENNAFIPRFTNMGSEGYETYRKMCRAVNLIAEGKE